MKILNLYCGIGGNRLLWKNCDVTAVELNEEIAKSYKSFFPNDTVVVGDAHKYLLEHHNEFDFIWSSPPCPTHGQYRYNVGFRAKNYKPVYPDMQLYEEIILLKYYYIGHYVVENVKPFYDPLIEPTAILQRHLFWSSFNIEYKKFGAKKIRSKNKISDYADIGFDITKTKIRNKRQVLRNCVNSELGLHIYNQMLKFVEPKHENNIDVDKFIVNWDDDDNNKY